MTASDEEVSAFLRNSSELACKVGGGVAGSLIGGLLAGPPGAVLGAALAPFLEHQLKRVSGEFLRRQLGDRQRIRAGAGALLVTAAVQRHLDEGETLRSDDFENADETGRRTMDELAEYAILSMINAVDERRLPYLANFYAGLYFDERIARSSMSTLIDIANSLNYRALCVLRIIGDARLYTGVFRFNETPVAWPSVDHIVAKEIFSLTSDSIIVSKTLSATHFEAILSYMEVEPQLLQMSEIGQILFEKMELSAIPDDDDVLVDTEQSIQRIIVAPSGTVLPDLSGVILDGGTF